MVAAEVVFKPRHGRSDDHIRQPGLIIAVWDRRRRGGTRAAGCRVAPNQLS
jgi:hypothetical protein